MSERNVKKKEKMAKGSWISFGSDEGIHRTPERRVPENRSSYLLARPHPRFIKSAAENRFAQGLGWLLGPARWRCDRDTVRVGHQQVGLRRAWKHNSRHRSSLRDDEVIEITRRPFAHHISPLMGTKPGHAGLPGGVSGFWRVCVFKTEKVSPPAAARLPLFLDPPKKPETADIIWDPSCVVSKLTRCSPKVAKGGMAEGVSSEAPCRRRDSSRLSRKEAPRPCGPLPPRSNPAGRGACGRDPGRCLWGTGRSDPLFFPGRERESTAKYLRRIQEFHFRALGLAATGQQNVQLRFIGRLADSGKALQVPRA